MSTHILNIERNQRPKDLLDFLNKSKLQKGDKVKMVSEEKSISSIAFYAIALLSIALAYYFDKRKKQESADKILQDVFKDYTTKEEYERHVEEEYGISIEIEQDSLEQEEWARFALKNLERAYGENEPDISDIVIKEPNPKYNPKV
jgi:thioredoxin-related protein